MDRLNPDSIVKPASNYAQGVRLAAGQQLVLVSGQCGVTRDGEILDGTEAQLRQCFRNIFAVVEDAGMTVSNIAKLTVFLTDVTDVGLYRSVRDEMLDGHQCASTLLVVSALAHPDWRVEIEAEAAA